MTSGMLPFLRAIAADPADKTNRLVFADWLDENGYDRWEAFGATRILTAFDFYSFEKGSGIGRGSGIGSGIGIGSGRGSGSGSGSGIGSGRGRGRGRGSGSGIGSGIGRGSGIGIGRGGRVTNGVTYLEIDKAYLVHCGDWHTFVGRCVAMISPVVYAMESVSKISNTNNQDNWHELASGNKTARDNATYIHYATRMIVPLTIGAFEWLGKTPQEE